VDGTLVVGGERSSPTGREPYRNPTLNTFTRDGAFQYQLYNWGGPMVGVDGVRLVSDSAVRVVEHDRSGANIYVVAWSDGGNSVMGRQPTDLFGTVGTRGVGLTAAGANATSLAYLVRLETTNYQVTGWTMWVSKYAGAANGADINTLAEVPDGSIAFAGGSAWGLVQTSTKLANGEPGGLYAAILTPDLTGVRFSSVLPGLGRAIVGNDSTMIGLGRGIVQGKSKVLVLGGAGSTGVQGGLTTPTPVVKAMQATNGGASDGWVALLDCSAPIVPHPDLDLPAEAQRLSLASLARPAGKSSKPKDGAVPMDGDTYRFLPEYPKFITVDVEFRDRANAWWPSYAIGRPVSGSITWQGGVPSGDYVLGCDTWLQSRGDQRRRILGELINAGAGPALRASVRITGPPVEHSFSSTDKRGKSQQRVVSACTAEASLTIADRTVPLTQAQVVVDAGFIVESERRKTQAVLFAETTGKALGLSGSAAEAVIDLRIRSFAVYGDPPPPKNKKGKGGKP
jgi:hypothetical protein